MTQSSAQPIPEAFLDERERNVLHWRCRRGLLENDLFIERFFALHGEHLTRSHAVGLDALMDLADNDLLDLLLRRVAPQGDLDTPEVALVLSMLLAAGGHPQHG